MCTLLHSMLSSGLALASASPQAFQTLPAVRLKLTVPRHPHPEVSAEIGRLEHLRQHMEAALECRLQVVYDAALVDAKAKIRKFFSTALHGVAKQPGLAFVQRAERAWHVQGTQSFTKVHHSLDDAFAVKVGVVPVHVPDSSVRTAIDRIERKRSRLEEQLVQQTEAEMGALTSIVLDELGRALTLHSQTSAGVIGHANMRRFPRLALSQMARNWSQDGNAKAHVGNLRPGLAFLQVAQGRDQGRGLPPQANIRVSASDVAFPRIAELVEEMERRRDRAEDALRAHIVELELHLLREENEAIQAAISDVVHT